MLIGTPLVAADRADFIARMARDGARIVVLDIPLLFETGAEPHLDGVAVVSTDAETQRARVMARPGMTADLFDMILSRQMPDAEKRKRADFIVHTDGGLEAARKQVEEVIRTVTAKA